MLTRRDLRGIISDYYKTADLDVENVPRREFALLGFDGFMKRHQGFNTIDELKKCASESYPIALYASLSLYLDPAARNSKNTNRSLNCQECGHSWKAEEGFKGSSHKAICPECHIVCEIQDTSKKDRRGQDLAFDIDYGDIPNTADMSPSQQLGAAARSTYNLYQLLINDFGIGQEDILITFSGGKGFHMRVKGEEYLHLSEKARKALISYVSGYNFNIMDFVKVRAMAHTGNAWSLRPHSSGWGKRFNNSVSYFLALSKSNYDDFKKMVHMHWPWHEEKAKYGKKKSLPSEKVMAGFYEACKENADSILKGGNIRQMKDANAKRLLSVSLARTRNLHASFVDRRVTADKARILRIPGSLHGKKGMVCCEVPSPDDLKNGLSVIFDMQRKALGTEDTEVEIRHVSNTYYGVYEPGVHVLPRYKAIAALCAQG